MTQIPKPIFAGPTSAPPDRPLGPRDPSARSAQRALDGYLAGLKRAASISRRRGDLTANASGGSPKGRRLGGAGRP